MSPPDEPSDNDFLFDLPLAAPTSDAADETGAEGADEDFFEVQRPLVFETSEAPPGAEAAAAFVTRGPDEPPLSSRLLAAVLDLGTIAAGLAVALGAALFLGVRLTLDLWPPLVLLVLCFSFLYTVMPLAFWGKTPGMAYTGIISRSKDGQPLTIPQTVLRWVGLVLVYAGAGLPALVALSGVSLSDLLSRSRVSVDDHSGLI